MKCAFYEHIPHYTFGLGKELGKKAELDIFFNSSSKLIGVPRCSAKRGFLGFPMYRRPQSLLALLHQVSSLSRYDLVHVQSAIQGVSASLANRIYSIPYIFTNHGIPRLDVPSSRNIDEKEHLLLPKIAKRSSSFVTISNYTKKLLLNRYDLNPEVIYHGVDFDTFNPHISGNSVRRNYFTKGKIVLSVMRLHPHKDPLTFLKAIPQIIKKEKAIFIVVGSGILEAELKDFVKKNKIRTHVILLPHVDDINRYFAACDVFVSTSLGEPFGMVAIEAMACRKPVVVSNSGAFPEAVGDAGLFFEPKNSMDLADKIVWLLSNRSVREELAFRGYNRVQDKFRWDIAAKRYLQLYQRALKRA